MEQYTVQCQECGFQEQKIFNYFGLAQMIAQNHSNEENHISEIHYKRGGKATMYPKGMKRQVGVKKSVWKIILGRIIQWTLFVTRKTKN